VKADEGTKRLSAAIALRESGQQQSIERVPEQPTYTEVEAPRELLNPGDWLEFRLVVDGGPNGVRVKGRVAGATLARRRTEGSDEMWKQTMENWAVMGKALAVGFLALLLIYGVIVFADWMES
jgi:hypothetical protein